MSPTLRGGGHIDFGADPVGVGIGIGVGIDMTLSCLHKLKTPLLVEFVFINLIQNGHVKILCYISAQKATLPVPLRITWLENVNPSPA